MRHAVRALWGALLLAVLSCEPPAAPPGPLLLPSARALTVPPGALAARVRHVYDGDTLTLEGGRKVRLLAVDTPELRGEGGGPEEGAREARDFVRALCEDRDVWLEFDVEREDSYGRWLSYVYVRTPEGDRMVNAELLRAGLARYYTPGPVNLKHAEFLLACQREAREAGRGTWKDYVLAREKPVVVTRTGRAYHRRDCETLRTSRGLRTVRLEEALDRGLSPCRTCRP